MRADEPSTVYLLCPTGKILLKAGKNQHLLYVGSGAPPPLNLCPMLGTKNDAPCPVLGIRRASTARKCFLGAGGEVFEGDNVPSTHIATVSHCAYEKSKEQLFFQPRFGVILMSISGQFFPCL